MKHRVPDHIKAQLVLDAIEKDPSGRKGPRTIQRDIVYDSGIPLTWCVDAILLWSSARLKLFLFSEFVDQVMHEFCPEGYLRHHPCSSKIPRTPLTSLGPNDEWSADGHDKLNKIGIAIYGFRDKASGYWLSLHIVPNNRLNVVITYLYLSLVEEKGGKLLCTSRVHAAIIFSCRYASSKHDRLWLRNDRLICAG